MNSDWVNLLKVGWKNFENERNSFELIFITLISKILEKIVI